MNNEDGSGQLETVVNDDTVNYVVSYAQIGDNVMHCQPPIIPEKGNSVLSFATVSSQTLPSSSFLQLLANSQHHFTKF